MELAASKRTVALLLLLFLALWLGAALLFLTQLNPTLGGASDFYPRWIGARGMLAGEDPYGLDITMQVPDGQGGTVGMERRFLYPAHITYLLLPFWLPSYPLAFGAWSGLQLVLVLLIPAALFGVLNWKVRPWLLGTVTFATLVGFRHIPNILVLGQFPIAVLAALVASWWGTAERRPALAAASLAFATIRPEGILLASGLLANYLPRRRWRMILLFGSIMLVLVALSFLQIGNWLPEFLEGIFGYQERGLSKYALEYLGSPVAAALASLALIGWGAGCSCDSAGWQIGWKLASTFPFSYFFSYWSCPSRSSTRWPTCWYLCSSARTSGGTWLGRRSSWWASWVPPGSFTSPIYGTCSCWCCRLPRGQR